MIPVLWRGSFEDLDVLPILYDLRINGSRAVPGFMRPEGIVIYHTQGNGAFKKTLEKDNLPKSLINA